MDAATNVLRAIDHKSGTMAFGSHLVVRRSRQDVGFGFLSTTRADGDR
jgi:hypothetical protein